MNKWLRISAWVLGTIIILALIAPYLIPSDFFKPRLLSQITAMTGKKVEIAGALRLSFLPSLGAHAHDVTLSVPGPKGADEKIATIKSMKVQMDTWSLLFDGNLVIQAFAFDDANIALRVGHDGIGNWQYEVPRPAAIGSEARRSKRKKLKSDNIFARSLYVENAEINNASITYLDERTKQQWSVEELNATFDLDGLNSPLMISAKAIVNKTPVSLEATISTPHTYMEASSARLEAEIKSALANASFKGAARGPIYTGDITMQSPSLKKLMAWLNSTAPTEFKGPPLALEMEGYLESTPVSRSITQIKLQLDDIKARGSIKTMLDQGVMPQTHVDLTTSMLDLTPYATTAANAQPGFMDALAAEDRDWSSEKVDLSALMLTNGTANLRIEGAKYKNLAIGKGLIQAKLQRGRLGIDMIDTAMADGTISLLSTIDAKYGAITSRIIMTNMRAEKFLGEVAQYDSLSGVTNADIRLASIGTSQKEWISALEGNGTLRLNDGSYKGYDIGQVARTIKAAFKPVKQESEKTDFSEATASFTISKGVLSNNDLLVKAPLLRVRGNGTTNLSDRTINYRLTPQLVETSQGQGGKDKEGLGVPVIVQGDWDHPTFTPDLAAAAQEILNDPQKLKDAVKSPEAQDAKKKIKGLLKKL